MLAVRTYLALALTLALASCSRTAPVDDAPKHELPDTLRVATLYSPASYFIYRDQKMGYDYALVEAMTRQKGIALDLRVAPSLAAAVAMLDSGEVDLLAYEVPVTAQYRGRVVPCGPVSVTSQVLVQPRGSDSLVTDVTQLVGRQVYVEADSKYSQRLSNLNAELGGGIDVRAVRRDTLITEDLIGMVASGEIPLTVVDSDIARVNKTYYPALDISLAISFGQKSAWAVVPENQWLADSVDAWLSGDEPRQENALQLKRYFELSKRAAPPRADFDFSRGTLSPYDDLLRRTAASIGWDWRLLAAMCYCESRFDPSLVSWAGARGLMQVMPATARAYGVEPEALDDPATALDVAVKVITALDRSLASRVPDKAERQKFIVAAYNSGIAHIYDAITIASRTGHDPTRWDSNVADALLLKANPEYYNAPDVKYGYFRGTQTTGYVREVYEFYDKCKAKIKA